MLAFSVCGAAHSCLLHKSVLLWTGPSFVPLTLEHQRLLNTAHNYSFVSKFGPMEVVTYRCVLYMLPVICIATLWSAMPSVTASHFGSLAAFLFCCCGSLRNCMLLPYREVAPNAADPALATMPPAVDMFLKVCWQLQQGMLCSGSE